MARRLNRGDQCQIGGKGGDNLFSNRRGGRVICDYSLTHVKSRPAQVGEKLVVKDFGMVTKGFASVDEKDTAAFESTAVCMLPGTEIAFDETVDALQYGCEPAFKTASKVARFCQVDKNLEYSHHDALEFGDGVFVKIARLAPGQTAVVLQLPAAPKTEQEAEALERLPVFV